MTSDIAIRPATAADAARIAAIYNHYVRATIATFEEAPVGDADMHKRIADGRAFLPWLVADIDGVVHGYAYAAAWRGRSGYRTSAEVTVYVAHDRQRRGVGRALYDALLMQLRARNLHTVIGVIALPNAASVALHESFGFTQVAELGQIGRKLGDWVDVGYWQLML